MQLKTRLRRACYELLWAYAEMDPAILTALLYEFF